MGTYYLYVVNRCTSGSHSRIPAAFPFLIHLPVRGQFLIEPAILDYAASKGGLTGMMKNLSTRLAEYNISVNDVAPAMIGDTGMLSNAAAFPEVAASIPLGR